MDLVKMEFKSLDFSGKFKDLIGNPTVPFHIMIYGLPGTGKSSLAILFAKYIADTFNFKIIFLVKEEGISKTTRDKFIRLKANHPNIDTIEQLDERIKNYDVLIIDTVNEMKMSPDDLRKIQKQCTNLSTVQLFKATKEGKFLGQSDFAHLCQAEFRCYDGKVQTTGKNRFGGNQEIEIFN